MGFFDIFKSKKSDAQSQQPQSAEQASQVEAKEKELNAGLEKTKQGIFAKLARAVAGRSTVDADVLDDLEEVLITSDVGVETTVKIIERIEARVARDKYINTAELNGILHDEIAQLMEEAEGSAENFGLDVKEGEPYVLMVVGVNGAGKTTTIGKLAAQLTKAGKQRLVIRHRKLQYLPQRQMFRGLLRFCLFDGLDRHRHTLLTPPPQHSTCCASQQQTCHQSCYTSSFHISLTNSHAA